MGFTHTASYSVKFRDGHAAVKCTIDLYRAAVSYLLGPVLDKWDDLSAIDTQLERKTFIENQIHTTKDNTAVYDFDQRFYKFPSYLRRSAIADAIGAVSSWKSNHKNWENDGRKGAEPVLGVSRDTCPVFYRGNMFQQTGTYTAIIKVFRNNDWVWQEIRLSKTDVDYLSRRIGTNTVVSAPVIEKKYGHYFLRFALTEQIEFPEFDVFDRRICAVDLGINTDAVCSVMDAHGTVLARRFINFAREKDSVYSALHRTSVFQRLHGSHDSGFLWTIAKNRNENHAHQIAHAITAFAVEHQCDVIVMEHLNTQGKKHGSKKQKLQMWRHKSIQKTVESLAHRNGIRISHVNAWNTSKLAYDGSGYVERGITQKNVERRRYSDGKKTVLKPKGSYSICRFKNGKIYNCDLSASYNIGARYFIREILRELSSDDPAEVCGIGSGTRRTLSDLWKLDKFLFVS